MICISYGLIEANFYVRMFLKAIFFSNFNLQYTYFCACGNSNFHLKKFTNLSGNYFHYISVSIRHLQILRSACFKLFSSLKLKLFGLLFFEKFKNYLTPPEITCRFFFLTVKIIGSQLICLDIHNEEILSN